MKAEVKGAGAGSTDDVVLLRQLARSSRLTDDHCHRQFFYEVATLLYDGNGAATLWLTDDLLEVTSLKLDRDGDGVFETTLVQGVDFWLYPNNDAPFIRIDFKTAIPMARRALQIVGLRGYSRTTQAAGTLGAAVISTTATAMTMAAGHDVSPGDTLVMPAGEQIAVTAVVTNALTVIRAINGTTAASYSNGDAVARRTFPEPIVMATIMQAARLYRETQSGYGGQIGNADLAGYSFRTMYPQIRDALSPYVVDLVA